MKRKILLLICIIMFLFTFVSMVTAQTHDNNGLVWILEPEYVHDDIHYCSGCPTRSDELSDMSDVDIIVKYMIYGNGFIGVEHGFVAEKYFYDKEKETFAIFLSSEGMSDIIYNTFDEFIEYLYPLNQSYLIPVGTIDLSEIESNKYDEERGYFIYTYTSDKYALMYGDKFITDFIYDNAESRKNYQNPPKDIIDMKINDKWGIIDKNVNVIVPFIFDDIEFINDEVAFAKYNGKYGIIDIEKTASAVVDSPKTGDKTWGFVVIFWGGIVCLCGVLKRYRSGSFVR